MGADLDLENLAQRGKIASNRFLAQIFVAPPETARGGIAVAIRSIPAGGSSFSEAYWWCTGRGALGAVVAATSFSMMVRSSIFRRVMP